MVWVDQPIGSGFSHGTVTARNEEDVAKQFMGFWKNFITLSSTRKRNSPERRVSRDEMKY